MEINENWNRRDLLKTISAAAFGAAVSTPIWSRETNNTPSLHASDPRHRKPVKPMTCIVLGAGNRGNTYAGFAEKYPDEMQIVGVAEPIPFRREIFSKKYGIPVEHQWVTWEHALEIPKFADTLIITMQDALHYDPAMQGMELGYDIILEKAMAQSWEECRNILFQSRKYGNILGICHVLRYTTYFRKVKEIVDSGALGEIVSLQHLEPVGNIHMSHSFVRGPWRNTKESNPMLLSKSCHDLDIIRWIIGKPCKRVTSFGSLKYFREDQAPAGSTARCTDGCPVESECPYSALRIYLREKLWGTWHMEIPDKEDETVLNALKTGPYGKCVYRTDNDVVDHQVMNMEFEDQITASFSMEALTNLHGGRQTRIFGTNGDLTGGGGILTYSNFKTGKKEKWDTSMGQKIDSGHGGGDHNLVRDFIQAVTQRDISLLTSNIEDSVESHLMGFKAEESRLNKGEVKEICLEV